MSAKVFAFTEDAKGNCIEHPINYEIKKNGDVFRLSFSGERIGETIFVKSLPMPTRHYASELGYKIATAMTLVIERGEFKNYLLYSKHKINGESFKSPILRCDLHVASALKTQLDKSMEKLGLKEDVTFGIKALEKNRPLHTNLFD